MLILFAQMEGNARAEEMLEAIFKSIPALNPSKDAFPYWSAVNNTMLGYSKELIELWKAEKQATLESIAIAKDQALIFLANEREKIMRMSHEEALLEAQGFIRLKAESESLSRSPITIAIRN